VTRHHSVIASSPRALPASPRMTEAWGIPLVLLIVLVASYWPTIVPLFKDWQGDDNYSVCQLVPLAALYLLWHDRKKLARCEVRPCWWGAIVILAAQAARAYGLVFLFESAERYSLVLTIIGLTLLVGGGQVFRQVFWILLFLFLMVPLPGRIHNMISGPLQGFATALAVATLELLGVTVVREGHTMLLNDSVPLAVAEACSGLRMLTAFVVVAFVLAYVVNRPRWQKTILVLSCIPVAIVCNQIRLVATALLFLVVSSQVGEKFFHEFAGLTMMPMAVLILAAELWILSHMVIEDEHERTKTRL
jgi:exosortase